jgi:hypothetical protein
MVRGSEEGLGVVEAKRRVDKLATRTLQLNADREKALFEGIKAVATPCSRSIMTKEQLDLDRTGNLFGNL